MKGDAAMAIWCMGQAITREMAAHHARIALQRGATPAEIADAWLAWEELQDSYVQRIESTAVTE